MKVSDAMAFHTLLVSLALFAVVSKVEPEPKYDPGKMIDTQVTVIQVLHGGENWPNSVRLIARTEADRRVNIYLGPASFLRGFEVKFEKGDRIHVVGSQVEFGGGTIVLAREVTKDQATLYLRDRQGNPYWRPVH